MSEFTRDTKDFLISWLEFFFHYHDVIYSAFFHPKGNKNKIIEKIKGVIPILY